jgi:hypothetical protein
MLTWEPTCTDDISCTCSGSYGPGFYLYGPDCCTDEDYAKAEFQHLINAGTALLGNFSKPSVVWRFHFPADSKCNQAVLLNYTFSNIPTMVNAGIMGIVYDSWMTQSGEGYGTPSSYGSPTDLDNTVADGALDNPTTGKGATFCAVQEFSQKALGLERLTYGQKVYAQDACTCVPCTPQEIGLGACGGTNTAQLDCAMGDPCTPPATDAYGRATLDVNGNPTAQWNGLGSDSDEYIYRCPDNCITNNCTSCNDSSVSSLKSYCNVERTGQPQEFAFMSYGNLTDDYWDFLAGLPYNQRCCLNVPVTGSMPGENATNSPMVKYTYSLLSSTKTNPVQDIFPSRGETGIDCGQTPDTSILTYCGVQIPISSETISCNQLTNGQANNLPFNGFNSGTLVNGQIIANSYVSNNVANQAFKTS